MRSLLITCLLGASITAAACGTHSPTSPTSASASNATTTTPPTPTATSGATVSGTVVGSSAASSVFRALGTTMTVSVTGTSTSSVVDGNGHFTLTNVPAGHVELHFMGTGVDARLAIEDVAERATVTITVRVNGSTAELDDNEREDPNHNVEVEGIVTAKTGSTLTVAGKIVTVNATTTIVHGSTTTTLADIHVGDRIHVHGTDAGTSIVATNIDVQNGEETPGAGDDHGGDGHADVELNGTVSGRSAGCPVTFAVSSTSVVTNASTEFADVTCASLVNGDRVQVKGARQTNGSVLASRVEKKK